MDRFNIFSLLREKIVSMRVSVRNRSDACVSRKMRESWKVCTSSFRNSKYKHATELSKFVWHLKDRNIKYSIKWRILAKCNSYSNKTKRCQLCLHEKFLIIYHSNLASLNSRNELLSKCRHRNKFLLSNKQLINSNVI